MRGLLDVADTRHLWAKFKRQRPSSEALTLSQRLKYTTSDGKTQLRDFTNAEGLYLITQWLTFTIPEVLIFTLNK